MKNYKKRSMDVSRVRELLEPGPIVMVSSAYKGETNIMSMGWHTVLEFTPSLIGCVISNANHSFEMIRKSKECVINVPTAELKLKLVQIGSCSGSEVDKFEAFDLTPQAGKFVKAPLIKECYANIECQLVDTRMIRKYNFFIFKVRRILKAQSPQFPRTIHYRGKSDFMLAGPPIKLPFYG